MAVRRLTSLDEAAGSLKVSRDEIMTVLPHCVPDFASRAVKKFTPQELTLIERSLLTIQIDIGRQTDGYVFRLHPLSKMRIKFPPGVKVASSIFISFERMSDFSVIHGTSMLGKQVRLMLIGLSDEVLLTQGFSNLIFFDVAAQETLQMIYLALESQVKSGHISPLGAYVAENLIAILAMGGGGRYPSRAWVYRTDDGQLAHTLDESIHAGHESWGGEPIPNNCLSADKTKVFERKQDQVKEYLKTFGLQGQEAEVVLQIVGCSG